MTLTPPVERKLLAYWPSPAERRMARARLTAEGIEASERVQLALLKLSEGSLAKLAQFCAAAQVDWRDVLLWAEYPEQGRLPRDHPDRAAVGRRDREQYEDWLRR